MRRNPDNLFPRWLYFLLILTRSLCLVFFVLFFLLFFFYQDFFTTFVNAFKIPFSLDSVYILIIFFQFFNSINSLVILFLISIIYYFTSYIVLKDKINGWVDVAVLSFSGFLIFNLTLTKLNISSIFILIGIYSFIYKLNTLDFNKFKTSKPVAFVTIPFLIPFVFELFFSSYVIFFLRNIKNKYLTAKKWNNWGYRISMILGANILAFISINLIYPSYTLPKQVRQITPGSFYGLQIDESTKRLFACNNLENNLYVFDLNNLNDKPKMIKVHSSELERLSINEGKREFYHFDRGQNRLLIYDLDNYKLRRASTCKLDGSGSAKLSFDNNSQTIVVGREDDYLYILDMQTLSPIKKLEIKKIDYIVYDSNTNKYIASIFQNSKDLYFISPRGQDVFSLEAKSNQADISVSNKRKELYVCFPFLSEVFVYDLNNLKLKRKIPTVFGVKHIACDDINDTIIVSSICTGFIDIIHLTDDKHTKQFVGYYLREIRVDTSRREAFISSFKSGIFKTNY
jgi:hypothetical protein